MRLRLPSPTGLRGRLILLLLGALLVAQVATLVLFLDERDRAVRAATAEETAARTLTLAQEIEALPRREREEAVRDARSRSIRFWIDEEPLVDQDEGRRLVELAARVGEAMDAPGPLRVAVRDPDDREMMEAGDPEEERRRGRDELFVSVALGDGLWLNARAGFRPPPLQWAWPALTSFGFAAVAAAAAVWVSVGRILRPMEALTKAAERLGRGEKPEPLPLMGPAEARRLADAFTRMADRLTRLLEERARTLAAIGHDLRSPLTAMRLRVEMVDDDETRERLGVCLDEIQTLVEAALALARGAGAEEARRPVELRALLEGLVRELSETGAREPEGPGARAPGGPSGGAEARAAQYRGERRALWRRGADRAPARGRRRADRDRG